MNKVFGRRFTRHEKGLLLVLILISLVGIYFYAVHYPTVQRRNEIKAEREDIEFKTEVAEARLIVYKSMKTELKHIFEMPKDELTVMPEYDNIQTLMNYFNVIFAGTDPVLNFDEVTVEGNIATRTMRFSFTAASYSQAKQILGQLTDTGFRCLMENVSIAPADSKGEVENGTLKVSGVIKFYELTTGTKDKDSKKAKDDDPDK